MKTAQINIELKEQIKEDYKQFLISKVGEKRTEDATPLYIKKDARDTAQACGAVKEMIQNYDIGIAIATGGLYLGYIAQNFGLPVLSVQMERRGDHGSIWQPIDTINEKHVKGKRILVLENDSMTGRTLSRALKEINAFNPYETGLLLEKKCTPIGISEYERLKEKGIIRKDLELRTTMRDLHFNVELVNTLPQIPEGFSPILAVGEYFEPNFKALSEFEQNFIEKSLGL